jgi:OmcA/MtrC family decaheme c-type cytochrome
VNKYTYDAVSTTDGFWNIGFPGILNNCEGCHLPDTYAFNTTAQQSALGASDNIDKRLYRTVGQGIYAANGATIPGFKLDNNNATLATSCIAGTATTGTALTDFRVSPFVTKSTTTITNYGIGFNFNPGPAAFGACDPVGNFYQTPPGGSVATPATTVAAAATTLVNSPTVTVCSACHDSADAISHFKIMGAAFYQPRGTAITGTNETCLLCHGAGRVADIKLMHSTNK